MYYLVEDTRVNSTLKYFYCAGVLWTTWHTTITSALLAPMEKPANYTSIQKALADNYFLKVLHKSIDPITATNHPELLV